MANVDGAVIVVPRDLKDTILREGYRCSRRRRIPCSRNREAALRAYRRCYSGRDHEYLQVVRLPPGVGAAEHKDGIKIDASHLPPYCLAASPAALFPGMTPGFGYPAASPALTPIVPPPSLRQRHPDRLALRDIYYTQDSIATRFRDGRSLRQMKSELEGRVKTVGEIPTITVVSHQGRWLTVDNRRLYIFKMVYPATTEIPVLIGVEDHRFFGKLEQPGGGTSVRVRGHL